MAILLWIFFKLLILHAKAHVNDNMELKMANVLYRHGDRSPVHTFPTDEHKNFWKQGLGQLTEKGMSQEFELGKFLKGRYVSKLLSETYLRKQVYCRSSDKDRTLMSAEAQMAGLYPSKPLQAVQGDHEWQFWQLIPIHTVPKQHDKLLRPHDAKCPRFEELRKESYSDPEYAKVEQDNKEFIHNISKYAGLSESLTLENIHKVHDVLFCENAHNLSMPKWATKDVLDKLKELYMFGFKWLFNTPQKSRLTGGVLLGEMINNMKNFAKNPDNSKILYVYSAHDTTVVALLSALNVYSGIPPPYSTAFLMELYYNTKSKDYRVRMFYRNETENPDKTYEISLPSCIPDNCTLEKFASETAGAVPVDYEAECGLRKNGSCQGMLAAVVIISLLVFLGIIGFVVRRCQKKRKASSRSQFRQVQVQEWDSD